MSKQFLNAVVIIIGDACVGLAIMYWTVPAGFLPTYLPGYIEGASETHLKHGIAAFLLGLAAFAYAWFNSK